MLADSNNNKQAETRQALKPEPVQLSTGEPSENATPAKENNPYSQQAVQDADEQSLILSDFILLPEGAAADAAKAATTSRYYRYCASLAGRSVLLLDAVPSAEWPAVLDQFGSGACPLYFSVCSQRRPDEALADVNLILAVWDDPDAMRLLGDAWPADQLLDFAPLPLPSTPTEGSPDDAASSEDAVNASATALALLKPDADRIQLAKRLADSGARAHSLWPVPVSAAHDLNRRLSRRRLSNKDGEGSKEDGGKRARLSALALANERPLWRLQAGQQAYLRISGLRRTADSVQLTDLTMYHLSGMAVSGYSMYLPGADCGKAVICTLKPGVSAESADAAAANLVQNFQRQGLQDSEQRPIVAQIVRPDTFQADDGQADCRLPDCFGDSFLPLLNEAAVDPVFLLIWNLPGDCSPNLIVHRMRRFLPMSRSFYCPRPAPSSGDNKLRNCGFAVARFDKPVDCAHAMRRLRSASQQQLVAIFFSGLIRFSYACLQESCHVPPMFTYPCHNLLPWLIKANQYSENPLDSLPDSPPYSPAPFCCPCHPDAIPSAPTGGMFDWLAFTLRLRQPNGDDSIGSFRLLSDLMCESEELAPLHATLAWLSCSSSQQSGVAANRSDSNAHLLRALDSSSGSNNNDDNDDDSDDDDSSVSSESEHWRLRLPRRALRCWLLSGFSADADPSELAAAVRRAFPPRLAANLYIAGHASLDGQLAVLRLPASLTVKVVEQAAKRLAEELLMGQPDIRFQQWGARSLRLINLRPTLAPFCPVPDACAARCQFILVWNLQRKMPPIEIATRFLDRFPLVRSVFVPAAAATNVSTNGGARNLGYCVLRFNQPRDCARILAALRSLTDYSAELSSLCPGSPIQISLCRMDDTCRLAPFQFPCHNMLPWYARRFLDHARSLCLESWKRPFRCVCHPSSAPLSPSSVEQLIRLSRLIRVAGSVGNVGYDSLNVALSEFLEAAESDSTAE